MNLNNGTYQPYSKPDNKLQYIHTKSNHPPNVIKQIPKTIEQRLSNHSSNETIFNQSKVPFEKALNESGYQETLSYNPTTMENRPKNRKRNITWFNPPYNKNVITKIGHKFLHLISKHFLSSTNSTRFSTTTPLKSVIAARKTSKASYRATTKTSSTKLKKMQTQKCATAE